MTSERLKELANRECGRPHYMEYRCVYCDCREMARELLTLREEREWISVEERFPEDTKAVIVRCPERRNTYTANWSYPHWYYFGGNSSEKLTEDVSHWLPLPPPPEPRKHNWDEPMCHCGQSLSAHRIGGGAEHDFVEQG